MGNAAAVNGAGFVVIALMLDTQLSTARLDCIYGAIR